MTLDRDNAATDALLTDLYLDALLAGAVLDAGVAGTPDDAAGQLDPAARRAAERLRHDLVRVHPSFRFEERLATRLAEAAVEMRVPIAAGDDGRIVAFRASPAIELDPELAPREGVGEGPDIDIRERIADIDPARRAPARPLLIGGALTSAALSIAGAAYVAWRLGRPGRSSTPMARAARAVREARLASAVGSTIATAGRATVRRPD
ncbi:MAG TPA: hypothetical protein VE817_09100 [Candidatus Acidoferrum sp.]|nr:hypothetical protein [Candidatus Acidoferrum sp.]